jgi:deoxycytidylate deaminase
MWLRSALRRGRDGLLRCENDQPGRDELTLAELTATRAAELSQRVGATLPADGAVPDVDSDGRPSSTSSYTGTTRRRTAEDVYNGDVPTGF